MFSRIHSINWVWGCIPLQFIFYPSNLNFLNSILYLVIPSPFHILYYIVPSTQCSYTLPRMKFPTVSLLFPDLMANIPYQFYMKLCEIFLLRQYFKILDTRGHGFLYQFGSVCGQISPPPFFLIELYFPHLWKHEIPNIFLTYLPILQPFRTLSANSLPFQGHKTFKSDSWLFQDLSGGTLPSPTLQIIFQAPPPQITFEKGIFLSWIRYVSCKLKAHTKNSRSFVGVVVFLTKFHNCRFIIILCGWQTWTCWLVQTQNQPTMNWKESPQIYAK